MSKPKTLDECWKKLKASCGEHWNKGQNEAARTYYYVGATDMGRLIFGVMADRTLSADMATAKLKMLEAELEKYVVEIAQLALKKNVNDPDPQMGEVVDDLKADMNKDRRRE